MNALPHWSQSIATLMRDSAVSLLLVKATVLLSLAWLAHGLLARANPRWRVGLWRATVAGIVLLPVLSWAPPTVEYRLATLGSAKSTRSARLNLNAQPLPIEATESSFRSGGDEVAATNVGKPQATQLVNYAAWSKDVREIAESVESVSELPRADVRGSAPVVRNPARFGLLAAWCAGLIWFTGVVIFTLRLIVGWLTLVRLVKRSEAAPSMIDLQCRKVARPLDCRRPVLVRLTTELSSPCLAGTLRPVVLLPQWTCQDAPPDRLPAILAHELAHARNHDLAWNLAVRVVSILLWFHPLVWRIAAAHAAACDAVCDAVAADIVGDVASYGRTLARLAMRAAGVSPVCGLAMARTSDVRRRIEALSWLGQATRLSWRRVIPALVAGCALLLVIGGFRLTRAEDHPPVVASFDDQTRSAPKDHAGEEVKPAIQTSSGKQTFHAVVAETGQPLEGVTINFRCRFDGKNLKGTVTTGKDGAATIEYPAGAHINYFEITARKPKFVPVSRFLRDQLRPVDLAAISDLRFETGTTIGGIVKDQAGRPVSAAEITVYARAKHEGDSELVSFQEIKTDAHGRWRLDTAPRDLAGVSVSVTHPRYQLNGGPASRDLDRAIVLLQGPSLSGRVIDSAGRPIKSAEVGFGYDRFDPNAPTATTNEQGKFTIENCERGASIVTVQADGFAPKIQSVTVNERTQPIEIKLTEPAAVLRVRIVDIHGNPVSGAFFGADTWRGHRSLQFSRKTAGDGRIEWKNAPRDAVLYDTGNFGFMSKRSVELIANGKEHVITLSPELSITGRVTDAQTGRPLPRFRLVRTNAILGSQRAPLNERWAHNEAIDFTGDRYTTRFSEPTEPFYLRVEADGYAPAESRAFKATEGNQTFNFSLKRSQNQLSGTVVLPDGKPAAGAEVLVNTNESGWLMHAGHFDPRINVSRIKAGSDGRLSFTPPADPYFLIALSDSGYAHIWPEDFARTGTVMLQPWGKIEGEVRIGSQPAPNQQVEFYPDPILRGGKSYNLTYGYTTLTDNRGRFAIDRVVPVPGSVSRTIPTASLGFPAWGWQEKVEVKPGQTARVNIGGKGRPVIGRIVLDGTPETTVDWTRNQPVTIRVPLREAKDAVNWRCFGSYIEKDGRFRVDDVPPGQYELEVIVNSDAYPKVRGDEAVIGSLRITIVVPGPSDGRLVEPMDLGSVKVRLFETLNVSDIAPDFTVPRIAGKGSGDLLKLGDYRGKLVLLDFWATWCGPCRAEIPAIKDIHKQFGGDARFQMISLSLDQTAETAQQFIRENSLIWTHGFTGNMLTGSGVGNAFKVRSIPATFLIAPDGRILAKNLRGAELKEAVRKALGDEKLFPARTQ